jgi:hypothetical protein
MFMIASGYRLEGRVWVGYRVEVGIHGIQGGGY